MWGNSSEGIRFGLRGGRRRDQSGGVKSETGSAVLKALALSAALGLGAGYVWQRQNAADRAAPDIQEEGARAVLPGSKSAWGFSPEAGGRAKAVPDLSSPEVSKPAEREGKGGKTPFIHDEGFVLPEDVEGKADRERTVLPGQEG
jgi:hypothetical protein